MLHCAQCIFWRLIETWFWLKFTHNLVITWTSEIWPRFCLFGLKFWVSLVQLASIQNRAKRVNGLPKNKYEDHCIQWLVHHRAVAAATLSHECSTRRPQSCYVSWCLTPMSMTPGCSGLCMRPHDLAVKVSRSNLVSHGRSFLPPIAQLWNSFPVHIPSIRSRASFSREVNRFSCASCQQL